MLEARAKADGGGAARLRAQRHAELGQRGGGHCIARQVGIDGNVIACLDLLQQSLQRRRRARQSHQVAFGQCTILLIFGDLGLGHLLGILHVGLVEGVDPQDMTGRGSRHFPAEHLSRQRIRVGQVELDHGKARTAQLHHSRIVLARLTQVHEQAVRAIIGRDARRLAVHGDDALAELAARLGHDLLDPRTKRSQGRVAQDRELVPAAQGGFSQHGAQDQSRVARGGHVGQRLVAHPGGAGEELVQVHADQRGGDQPKVRQRRITAAHHRVRVEDLAEAALFAERFERGARIGSDDKARAVAPGQFPEIIEPSHHLGGAARFAGDDVQRLGRREVSARFQHLGGVGRVEDRQSVFGVREEQREDLGRERGAAHADDEEFLDALCMDLIGKGLDLGNGRARADG